MSGLLRGRGVGDLAEKGVVPGVGTVNRAAGERARLFIQRARGTDREICVPQQIAVVAPHRAVIAVKDLQLVNILIDHAIRPQQGKIPSVGRPAERDDRLRRLRQQRGQLPRERGIDKIQPLADRLGGQHVIVRAVRREIEHQCVFLFTVCAGELLRPLIERQVPVERRRKDDHAPPPRKAAERSAQLPCIPQRPHRGERATHERGKLAEKGGKAPMKQMRGKAAHKTPDTKEHGSDSFQSPAAAR